MKNNNTYALALRPCMVMVWILLMGCDDFVKIDPPRTTLIRSTVFEEDATANAAIVNIYYEMKTTGFASGSQSSISYFASYSSDEQINYAPEAYQQFNDNELLPDNSLVLGLWSQMYKAIYMANSIIEGVSQSQALSDTVRSQLIGEAKVIRAFCNLYLVNLFGDIPLITSTDYRINATIARAPTDQVYEFIIADLSAAQKLLPTGYAVSNNERVRVNREVATALLARVYLYRSDWINAEIEASKVIQNTPLYSIVQDLDLVFRKNSSESIWQFHTTTLPNDFSTFRVTSSGPNTGVLRDEFVNSFEPNDNRRVKWIRNRTNNGVQYFFPGKYKSAVAGEDYSTIIRLSEIYLIRSEARAKLNDVENAKSDLNVIRHRAGLGDTPANDLSALLLAIEQERKVELFTEHGHRWFDLKRTDRVNELLAPVKGDNWQLTDILYPIPETQIISDPAMRGAQNPGY